MHRYRLTVEYDGRPYAGWQRQENAPSVQQAIETAFSAFAGEQPTLHGAGRTDAGVHATGQVAHVDLSRTWTPFRLMEALNAHLVEADETVAILDVAAASPDFHARFSATARHYLYRILNRRAPPALERGRAWHVKKGILDAAAMHAAAQRLLGRHDFTTFRATQCQAPSPVKTLDRLDVTRDGDMVEIRASARSFLHNQVRSMVGSLKLVGDGKWSDDDLVAALEARDRTACAAVAPPDGLYLMQVDYDD